MHGISCMYYVHDYYYVLPHSSVFFLGFGSFALLIDRNTSLIEEELNKGQLSDDNTQITHLQDRSVFKQTPLI